VLEMAVGAEVAAEFGVFAGDQVKTKKPAPDIYLMALEELGVAPDQAVVVEDSNQGLRASLAAGIPTIVTISSYTADEDFTGAAAVVSDLGEPDAPMRVLANAAGLDLGGMVTLDALARLVRS
ncbi:MAG: HAD-IA family hydrolase, partial [Brooklawnia sp.]|uniref:HAD-IA family hydrolase n=1 Tax=Brooklawnia sp. TaxID=2699740 RepID=UPI003C755694